jgi:6-phosphogluconolactonase
MRTRPLSLTICTLLVGAFAFMTLTAFEQGTSSSAKDILVLFGTYTGAKSKGIYSARLDVATGALSRPELAGETANPSFLALHPTHDYVYAVNEIGEYDGKPSGSVSAFAFDRAAGTLKMLNRQPSVGAVPAHLVVDHAGRNVLVANYGGGSAAVLPISADGTLKPASAFVQHTGGSVNPERQKAPHAHSINVDGADMFAYVADLGLDKVMIYAFNSEKGTLVANDPPFATVQPGAGPRHLAIHPQGRYAYVINEMLCTITAFSRDPANGGLTTLQTISTLPEGQSVQKGYSTAEVQVHPSGRFLYGSNRGHDSISVFSIDEASGRLTYVENRPTEGSTPRNFGIDPSGTYLLAANQRSDSVVVFRIDQQSGRLTPTGARIDIGAPVCVKFVRPR